jgi:hypothetical protein
MESVDYKLELNAEFSIPAKNDKCALCGDIITDMRITISSDRTKSNQLMIILDDPCFQQIIALGLKVIYETTETPITKEPN